MTSGIRAEVRVDAAESCPVAEAARSAGTDTVSISRSVTPDERTVTEEFMLDLAGPSPPDLDDPVREVFDYGSKRVYRFDRDLGEGCPCEVVERVGCPVVDVHTRDGDLYLVFHAEDMEQLGAVVEDLQERFPSVDVRRLLRSDGDDPGSDLVFVDRGSLTDRQREVLESAHGMGYFDHPKGANAGEVAAELGVSRSTFAEHLAAAQSKVLESILTD